MALGQAPGDQLAHTPSRRRRRVWIENQNLGESPAGRTSASTLRASPAVEDGRCQPVLRRVPARAASMAASTISHAHHARSGGGQGQAE